MKILNFFSSKQIRHAAIGSLGIKFLSALFALVNSILLAKVLSINGFGIYILAYTTVLLLSIPVSLGLPNLITRYISKYEVDNESAAIKGLLIRSNQLVVLTSLMAALLALISYAFWWKSYSLDIVLTFWYSFLLLPVLAFGALRSAALRGLKFIVLGQLPDTFLRNFFFTAFLLCFLIFDYQIVSYIAMILHAISAFLAFLVGYWFLKIKLLNRLKKVKPIYANRLWIKEAIPFTIIGGVQVIKQKLLTYVLAIFGSVEAVAIFEVAIRGAALVSFTVDALNTAIAPYISSAFELQQMDALQRIVKKVARIVFGFSLPIALIFIIGGKPVIGFLFGENYYVSYIPLVIACCGYLINSIAGPTGSVLIMTGNQHYLSKNQTMMLIATAVLSVPLIHFYDVIGAAIVFSMVIFLQDSILVFFIRRKLKINTTIF